MECKIMQISQLLQHKTGLFLTSVKNNPVNFIIGQREYQFYLILSTKDIFNQVSFVSVLFVNLVTLGSDNTQAEFFAVF